MYFHTSVHRHGKKLFVSGYENGEKFNRTVEHYPQLYVQTEKESDWHALDGTPVKPVDLGSYSEYWEFLQQYKDISNFPIHGNINSIYSYINQEFGMNPDNFDKELIRVTPIDIEVNAPEFPDPKEAKWPVDAITLHDIHNDKFYVWTLNHHWSQKNTIHQDLIIDCRVFEKETDLLKDFVRTLGNINPDVLTGWYCRLFDIPYLVNRLTRLFSENYAKELSPFNRVNFKEIYVKGKALHAYEIVGIQQMDMLDVFQKFALNHPAYGPQESYTLNHISWVVLKEEKLDYSEMQSLQELATKDHQKYIDYNIKDTKLVSQIIEATGFMQLAFNIAYKAGCNFQDTLGTTAIWDAFLYREMLKDKIAVPPQKDHPSFQGFSGGHVKPPRIGLNRWVVSFDVNSMYPNIFVMNNMSPETISGFDPDISIERCITSKSGLNSEYCVAANGALFSKERKGIIPTVVERLYQERVEVKKAMKNTKDEAEISRLDGRQMAIKILMNSLYGASGNQYFRYFDPKIAEGITMTGRYIIQKTEEHVNKYLQNLLKCDDDFCVAIDTDSNYFVLDKLVEKVGLTDPDKIVAFIDKVCEEKIQKVLKGAFNEIETILNAHTSSMYMARESIAQAAIWTGKKHYIMLVNDKEGKRHQTPELKITGMEAKKSSYPRVCRDNLTEIYREILVTQDVDHCRKLVKRYETEFSQMTADKIAFPRGASNISGYTDHASLYRKGTPMHVRAAILYNHMREKNKLTKEKPLTDGDKLKYVYLKLPNPLQENVIGFVDGLPEAFELDEYIDYKSQFEKAFIQPIEPIFKALKWDLEEKQTVEGLFV